MEYNKFQEIIEGIIKGKFPLMSGVNISAEQYLQIQTACGELISKLDAEETKGLEKIAQYLFGWRSRIGVDLSDAFVQSNKPLLEKIKEVVSQHYSKNDTLLIVHGDDTNQKAHFQIFGKPQSAAMAFAALLDNDNSEFKRFIFSLLGVYLAKNPEDHRMFMDGISMARQTPGVN